MHETGSALAWASEALPRCGIAGFLIAAVTVERGVKQTHATSLGQLPKVATNSHRLGIFRASIAKQSLLTTGQYVATREIKLLLDRWHCPPWLSLVVACGLAGVPFSSLQYNWVIQDTYAYHGFPPPPLDGGFLRIKVAPGLAWCFMRAGCGTGGALYFGPSMTARVQQFPCHAGYEELPSQLARLGGGLITGAIGSLATQGVHNITLVAGRMAALGAQKQAPHYTVVAAKAAWQEMGVRMFYLNFGPRMAINAVSVSVLNLCDIFRAPG